MALEAESMRPRPSPPPAAELGTALRRVHRYLRFLGCPVATAEDCAQETMLAALRHFGDRLPPVPWLLTTARNCYRTQLRRLPRAPAVDLDLVHAQWLEVAGEDAGDERLAALRTCLAELPTRSRRALQLCYGDGASRQAIARELAIGQHGVKSMLRRLRHLLAACIQRRLGS